MSINYLKKAEKTSHTNKTDIRELVSNLLDEVKSGGDQAAINLTEKFDKYTGNIVLGEEDIHQASKNVSAKLKDDIQFAYENVKNFAQQQLNTVKDFEYEIRPGFIAGQKAIPCNAAGCYIPGGRYAHIASAIMTVTTAKVAGCKHIAACSPPSQQNGVHPAIIYTANLCGADTILAMGGVQAIASMAYGLFSLPKSDILVGPGNQYVAEAKRILFGEVGIDMFAGPTDSLIIADDDADANIIAHDLVGQAEHGYNSPVWLVTTSNEIAKTVAQLVPKLIDDLPELNKVNAKAAWQDYAEIIVCDTKGEMVQVSDSYSPEHLTVQAADLDWWLKNLSSYGSLFLGEETTVAFGDKASGTNHVLPTSGAARYTGGLSVHKYLKLVTWQKSSKDAMKQVAEATARISRLEGMEGHARTADVRLHKYFPNENFDLKV